MKIQSTITLSSGDTYDLTYKDIESEHELGDRKVKGVHAYCFFEGKLVVVYAEAKHMWTPPGGGVEEGEGVQDAVVREVREESNMRVLHQKLIGFQDIHEPNGIATQTRSVCLVEPYGPFLTDPDEDITEIRLIEPGEYKDYFDWGEVGDHIMQRALELAKEMEEN